MPVTTHLDLLDGQLYTPGEIITTMSRPPRTGYNAESSTVIPFGFGVCRGSSDGDLILPVNGSSTFAGVAVLMQIEKRTGYSLDGASRFGCPVDHEMPYLEEGEIAVWIDGNVTEFGAVYLSHTASSSIVGMFRGDSNSSNALQVTGARWLKTVTATSAAPALAPLRLNRP